MVTRNQTQENQGKFLTSSLHASRLHLASLVQKSKIEVPHKSILIVEAQLNTPMCTLETPLVYL
jgi:hypothetical protein